jgi:hypothetical protein
MALVLRQSLPCSIFRSRCGAGTRAAVATSQAGGGHGEPRPGQTASRAARGGRREGLLRCSSEQHGGHGAAAATAGASSDGEDPLCPVDPARAAHTRAVGIVRAFAWGPGGAGIVESGRAGAGVAGAVDPAGAATEVAGIVDLEEPAAGVAGIVDPEGTPAGVAGILHPQGPAARVAGIVDPEGPSAGVAGTPHPGGAGAGVAGGVAGCIVQPAVHFDPRAAAERTWIRRPL